MVQRPPAVSLIKGPEGGCGTSAGASQHPGAAQPPSEAPRGTGEIGFRAFSIGLLDFCAKTDGLRRFCECGVDQPFTLRARNSRARRSESSAAFSLYEGAMWSGSAKL